MTPDHANSRLKLHWLERLRQPHILLMLTAAAMPVSFVAWSTLINNFTIEQAGFTGREIGILQSLREVPGFLSFLVVYLLFVIAEQRLALLALALLGFGVAITGYFPTVLGLYITTVISSIGFHYYETCNQSLAMQWLDKKTAPMMLGRIYGVASAAQVLTLTAIFTAVLLISPQIAGVSSGDDGFDLPAMLEGLGQAGSGWPISADAYAVFYLVGGLVTMLAAVAGLTLFPRFTAIAKQKRSIILRRRYWLYYALIFMSGARRQIFVVFAGFLMVERFGFSVGQIAMLFLVNALMNIWLAPLVGRLIQQLGERRALIVEYIGLVGVFTAYAFAETAAVGAVLYLLDHAFFAMAIAIKTYFQKIADSGDFAATSAVSFTINHIVAVVLPAVFGLLWLVSPAAVFLCGAGLAAVSLLLALMVPHDPAPGNEAMLPGPFFAGLRSSG